MASHGKSFIQFVTTPTADTPGTCLILNFNEKRYLIGNVHEGLQRACIQRGIKLNRVSDIFFTGRTEWKNTGGLLGMALTLADVHKSSQISFAETIRLSQIRREKAMRLPGQSQDHVDKLRRDHEARLMKETLQLANTEKIRLALHGGANLLYTVATARKFVFRKGMPLDIRENTKGSSEDAGWKPTFTDDFIQAWAMPIDPETVARKESSQSDDSDSDSPFSTPNKKEFQTKALGRVVAEMFDSDWQYDALFEVKLREITKPGALFIRNKTSNKIERYKGPLPGSGADLPDITVLVRNPWPAALVGDLPRNKPSQSSLSYIIRNHPQRGKFLPEKAKALGVTPGPDFNLLTRGIPVLSKGGKEVRPEQVMEESRAGGGFAVVDLPTRDYITGLINRGEWKAESVMTGVEAIIWNLGNGVLDDERLQNFISEQKRYKHVISSTDYCPNYLAMDSSARAMIVHHQIDPKRFGVPVHSNHAKPLPPKVADCTLANRGLAIILEPSVSINLPSAVPPLNTAEVLKVTPPNVLKLAKDAKSEIESAEVQRQYQNQGLPSPEAEMIALGTGSSTPSKYRNVSGTLLRVPQVGSYLLDCGENTLGQLSRVYGSEELLGVLRDLKMICISHLHADHHLGIVSIIRAWNEAVFGEEFRKSRFVRRASAEAIENPAKYLTERQKLFVVAEPAMQRWLYEYSLVENYGHHNLIILDPIIQNGIATQFLLGGKTNVGFDVQAPLISKAMCVATGLSGLATAAVKHCQGSSAVSLTFPSGFKFSYSGDCRPSKKFVKIGKDSTVLLHEATFDDDLKGDAKAKNHSTISEAIGVGKAMGARCIFLTHFSQRYQKIPDLDGLANKDFGPILEDSDDEPVEDLPVESGISPLQNLSSGLKDSDTTDGIDSQAVKSIAESQTEASTASLTTQRPRKDIGIAVAYDLMRVKVKDIMLLEKFTPTFLKLYEELQAADTINTSRQIERNNSGGEITSPKKRGRSPEESARPGSRSRSKSRSPEKGEQKKGEDAARVVA